MSPVYAPDVYGSYGSRAFLCEKGFDVVPVACLRACLHLYLQLQFHLHMHVHLRLHTLRKSSELIPNQIIALTLSRFNAEINKPTAKLNKPNAKNQRPLIQNNPVQSQK